MKFLSEILITPIRKFNRKVLDSKCKVSYYIYSSEREITHMFILKRDSKGRKIQVEVKNLREARKLGGKVRSTPHPGARIIK